MAIYTKCSENGQWPAVISDSVCVCVHGCVGCVCGGGGTHMCTLRMCNSQPLPVDRLQIEGAYSVGILKIIMQHFIGNNLACSAQIYNSSLYSPGVVEC